MAHGFTSAGLLASQYESFCRGANLGLLNEHYISSVYDEMRYCEAVDMMVDYSIVEVVEEIKADAAYAVDGAGVMVDARHDSARAAYHTTVTAISMTNRKVIGVVNRSKEDIAAQSREKPMTLELIDKLTGEEGLNITEVSHDTVVGIKNDLRSRGISNSFDTWHVKSIKTHCYYAMKNCGGDAEKLRSQLRNIVEHYKGNHRECNQESRCRTQEDYVPTKRLIKNPNAAQALLKAIMSTSIYKHAEDFAKVCTSKAHFT